MLYKNLKKNPIENFDRKLWPPGLSNIPCPPEKLSIRGLNNFLNLQKSEYKFLTVVGSRNFTEYGEKVCQQLIAGLKGYNICIVSGLAYGIDSIAHQTALENNLPTIAFPGSSLEINSIYPSAHVELADEIIGSGGCLISEFENNKKGQSWMFPQRNRLMVGIADAVLIIEAAEKSGSGITAHMAVEYDRNLLAVPGSIFNHNSEMTNRLIRSGANLVASSQNILSELGFDQLIETGKNRIEKRLNVLENTVLNFIQNGLTDREKILKETQIPISELNRIMSKLEIEGLL